MTEKVECHECGTLRPISKMYKFEVWYRPFDEQSHTIYVCKETPKALKKDERSSLYYIESCEELLTDTSWADFRYFTCEYCNRMICEQNPSNGWMSQVRYLDNDSYENPVCLKCYEKILYEDGVPLEEFEAGRLPGMFLSDVELRDYGFEMVIEDAHVTGESSAKRVCKKAIELINQGKKVLVAYESVAIGGLEGYVSLYAADKE